MIQNLSSKRFGVQILALLACTILGVFLFAAFSSMAMGLFPHIPKSTFETMDGSNDALIPFLKIVLPIQTFFVFGFAALLFAKLAHPQSSHYIGFRQPVASNHLLLGMAAMISGLYFVMLLATWNKAIPMPASWIGEEKKLEILTMKLLDMNSMPQFLYMLVCIGFLPAVCEELFFRGALQNVLIDWFGKKHAWTAIIIVGIIFGIIHGQMQTVLPRIFMGVVLGFIYFYSNSIYTCILAHFINNGLQVVAAYVGKQNANIEKLANQTTVPPLYGIASMIICYLCIVGIYKTRQQYILYKAENETPSTII
jgi:uncharacterized protein